MAGAFSVDTEPLEKVARALAREEGGLRLRRALAKELRQAVDPAVQDARAGIASMHSGGGKRNGTSLRAAIAEQIKAEARLSGTKAGVRVRATKKGMPRGFANAPKRTNRASGWRHPVPPPRLPKGVEGPKLPPTWVHQVGKPGWFDDPMGEHAPEYLAAVQKVVADTADRISRGGI